MTNLPEHDTEAQAPTIAEAADAVKPAYLEAVQKMAPNVAESLQASLASLGADIAAREAIEGEAASIKTSTASRPAPLPPEAKPKTAEVIQLTFWGEEHRAAPNALLRSALFPALNGNQKENRRYLENEEVFSVSGLTVYFTGKQFDQSDLDVYLELLNMAQPFPLGTPIRFSAHALLKALGLHTGGREHARLHQVLIRLRSGTTDITDHKKRYFGGLIEGGFRDEITMNYEITINPKFAILFGFGMYAKIDLETRRALGRNNTAKALHAYFSSHIKPDFHSFETLVHIVGLTNTNKRQAKATILKAFKALERACFCESHEERGDTIRPVNIDQTPSQRRAILKAATKPAPRRKKGVKVGELLPGLLD